MTTVYAVPGSPFIQYDGTNSSDVMDFFEANITAPWGNAVATVLSESGGVLNYRVSFDPVNSGTPEVGDAVLNAGEWAAPGCPPGDGIPDAVFSTRYVQV